jgi:hypothetical protein
MDVRLSIEVHIDGRCDGAVDAGYGCQLEPSLLTIGEVTGAAKCARLRARWSPSGVPWRRWPGPMVFVSVGRGIRVTW